MSSASSVQKAIYQLFVTNLVPGPEIVLVVQICLPAQHAMADYQHFSFADSPQF
jgi:hypothetical protein